MECQKRQKFQSRISRCRCDVQQEPLQGVVLAFEKLSGLRNDGCEGSAWQKSRKQPVTKRKRDRPQQHAGKTPRARPAPRNKPQGSEGVKWRGAPKSQNAKQQNRPSERAPPKMHWTRQKCWRNSCVAETCAWSMDA
eukprot:6247413-Amphidinium_carterae.1